MPNFVDVKYQQTGKSLDTDALGMREMQKRAFEQKFRLEQFVEVKDAKLSDGLLTISLKREIPEERKPKKIPLKVA